MKNEINDISKKKSFFKEFLKEYILHLIAALILLYFTVAGIIGNFLSKKDKTEALDSDIIAVNEKETLGAKGKRYNTGNKAYNSAG